MPDARDLLFSNYKRLFGNPKSFFINNQEELNRNAFLNSSVNDSNWASICSYNSDKVPVFEDCFFETDDYTPEPVRKVVLWFETKNIPWICLLSGNRGIHLHGLFQSQIISRKTLKNFADMILEETNTAEFFDPHVSGVLEKLCRIPNTQRLGNGWCVPITRKELFEINDPNEFKKLCVAPRFIDFSELNRPSILQFIKEEVDDIIVPSIQVAPPKNVFFLKQILRPCVYKSIISPNPRNDFRLAATVSMYNHGLNSTQIFNTFMTLNWIDFCPDKTKYQILKIEEKRKLGEMMVAFGKKKLGCEKKISCFQCVLNGE